MAIAPTTGRNVAVVAMLLVSSVRKMIIVAARMTMMASGNAPTACRLVPSHSASPVIRDGTGQRQAATEQQQHAPGQLLRVFPAQQQGIAFVAARNQKQRMRAGHRDAGIIERRQSWKVGEQNGRPIQASAMRRRRSRRESPAS